MQEYEVQRNSAEPALRYCEVCRGGDTGIRGGVQVWSVVEICNYTVLNIMQRFGLLVDRAGLG